MRIAATDVDAGENAHISYGWDAGSGPDAEYFDLDKATGAIHLKKKITVYILFNYNYHAESLTSFNSF